MNVGTVGHCITNQQEQTLANQRGFSIETYTYVCGGCGKDVQGRIIAKCPCDKSGINGKILWCLCPACGQPTVITIMNTATGEQIQQHPMAMEFISGENWPDDLEQLFEEAGKAFSAGAFTACAMVCRKILMAVACKHGGTPGKSFLEYVDHIVDRVVPVANAKNSIDQIRKIGNEANHEIAFVSQQDARRVLGIARYILNAVYSLPAA